MSERNMEVRLAAEAAASWVLILPEATAAELAEFKRWLLAAPLHVREYLLAVHIHRKFKALDIQRRLRFG